VDVTRRVQTIDAGVALLAASGAAVGEASRRAERVVRASAVGLMLAAGLLVFVSGAAATGREVTTVTLVARTAHAPALEAAIARFEALHPDIAIKASYPSPAVLSSTILNGLANGTAPDIMVMSTSGAGTAGLPSLWALGPQYLTDLSNERWVKQLWRPLLPLAGVAGKVYGEPIDTGSIQLVIYNRDVFAQHGLTAPTTWAGLLSLCSRIADQGIVPIELGGGDAVSAGAIGTAIAANTVYTANPNWSPQRNRGEVSFAATPGWHQALQMLSDMQAARCFEPSPATVNAGAAYSAFDSGQAAMMVAGGWDLILNVQQANPSLDVGFFPLPGASLKRTRVMVSPGEYLTVNAASPVKEQAVQFLDFVAGAWPGVAMATTENTISTLDLIKGVVPKWMAAFAPFIKRQEFVVSPLIYDNKPGGVAAFRAGITSLLAGTSTVDQALANTDAAW
jgi:raffinose/stachyose/melibiose transport system substrate-binding protein